MRSDMGECPTTEVNVVVRALNYTLTFGRAISRHVASCPRELRRMHSLLATTQHTCIGAKFGRRLISRLVRISATPIA